MPATTTALVAAALLTMLPAATRSCTVDDGLRPAVRLGPVAPPPAGLDYPTGRCDTIIPGLEGLAGAPPMASERIGTSVQGRPIYAEYWGPPSPERRILVVGQVHGDECAPSRLVRAIRATAFAHIGIWLIPTLNPDGYAAGTRENANGIDLNEDGHTQSQPETQALMAFTSRLRPTFTIHAHSPNGETGWYGGTAARSLGDQIAWRMVGACGVNMPGGYANARTDPARWFLWQGQGQLGTGQQSLLVELHAIADSEVPNATPRPPSQSLLTVDCEAHEVLAVLDQ